jgi:hypothetical protein
MCLELILSSVYTRDAMDSYAASAHRSMTFSPMWTSASYDGTESSVRVLEINHWDDAPVFFMFDGCWRKVVRWWKQQRVFFDAPSNRPLGRYLDVWASEFIVDLVTTHLLSDHATNLNIGFDIASLRVSSVKMSHPTWHGSRHFGM